MKQIIEEISNAYREKLNGIQKMQTELNELENKLSDENLLAKDYFQFEKRIKFLKEEINNEQKFADGISFAREIAFDPNCNKGKAMNGESQLPVLREPTEEEKYLVLLFRNVCEHADAEVCWTNDYEDAVRTGKSPEYEAYTIVEPNKLVYVD